MIHAHRSVVTKKFGRKTALCILAILSVLLIKLATYFLLDRYFFLKIRFPVDLTDIDKCPGCVGQSICPNVFRGEISLSRFQYRRLADQRQHSTSFGLEATMGLYETSRKITLRRIGSPASTDAVDESVCLRGLPHGYSEASDLARSKLRCIPHLAIWRWRPTNSLSELPLHRGIVAAPVYRATDANLTELMWSELVMRTSFAPATRCASDRLFERLIQRFRERTSWGAETRWLRFDELMFLFNLAVDPQAVIWQSFLRSERWPLPTYIGACGRWVVQDYHGVPLGQLCASPFWMRLRILRNILTVPDMLERPSSSEGYAIYLSNFHLASLFTVDPKTYNITVANLRHAIIVDTYTLSKQFGLAEFTVPLEATDVVIKKYSSDRCEGNTSKVGDAGGTTPPCLSRSHADELCTHAKSDHNYWAVCSALLHGTSSSDACSRFLLEMPKDLLDALRRCVADDRPGARQLALEDAKRITSQLILAHPEPSLW